MSGLSAAERDAAAWLAAKAQTLSGDQLPLWRLGATHWCRCCRARLPR